MIPVKKKENSRGMKENQNYREGEAAVEKTVFNRVEKKYLLTLKKFHQLWEELMEYMLVDEYGLHTICNIYYDTENNELIRNSIEKPVYKEKFRVRSYGVPESFDNVFLEIKKKYNGIVNKRRMILPLEEAENYLNHKQKISQDSQIFHEIDYFINRYELMPKMFLAYERVALYGKEDSEFRVTFDRNIRSRNWDLTLSKGDSGVLLLEDGSMLMEVKISGAMPMWFAKLLSKYEIFSTSFSKYGSVYKKQLRQQLEGKDFNVMEGRLYSRENKFKLENSLVG